jgi:hypothetical protein
MDRDKVLFEQNFLSPNFLIKNSPPRKLTRLINSPYHRPRRKVGRGKREKRKERKKRERRERREREERKKREERIEKRRITDGECFDALSLESQRSSLLFSSLLVLFPPISFSVLTCLSSFRSFHVLICLGISKGITPRRADFHNLCHNLQLFYFSIPSLR